MNHLPTVPARASRPARLLPAAVFIAAVVLAVSASFGSQKKAQPAPATPLPAIQFANGGNAAVFPMELAAGAVFVPARVDGSRPTSWLLDTAALRTAVDPTLARQIGFDPSSAREINLPALAILPPQFFSQNLQALGPWYGQRAAGILGLDFLDRIVANLDYSRLSVEIYDPASWHPSSPLGQKLDVRWVAGLPVVAARLRLAGREVDGNFLLDTTSSSAIGVSSRFLAAHGMFPFQGETAPSIAVNASGAQDVWLTRGTWLQLGSIQVSRPLVSITQEEKAALDAGRSIKKGKANQDSIDGWLGGLLLKKFRLILDFPANRIYLAPNHDFVFPFEPDASGATVTATGPDLRAYEIHDVRPDSPAAQAGLYPGDRILTVDGESATDLSLDQIRDLLTDTDKSPILVVRRLGRNFKVELKLQSPI